jgi:hypothetical protein
VDNDSHFGAWSGDPEPMTQQAPRKLRRLRPLRWRDVRLWLGIALVIAAMMLGAALLSGDDERILVWQATSDMAIGAEPIHVEPILVALGSAQAAYLSAQTKPTGRLTMPVTRGQLIPNAAIETGVDDGHLVTVGVDLTHAPINLAAGQLVAVWATSEEGETSLVLPKLRVAAVADDGMRGGLQVVLDVPPSDIPRVIAAVRTQVIDLVAVPVSAVMP